MKKWLTAPVFALLCLGTALFGTLAAQADSTKPAAGADTPYVGIKQRLAVLPLRWQVSAPSEYQLGLNEVFTDELFHTGRYIVVERKDIDRIMQEQSLGQSGAVTPQTAAKVGKLLGAEILVDGAITQYENQAAGNKQGFSFGGLSVGGGSSEAQLTMTIRLMDATTGEIIASEKAVGHATTKGSAFQINTGVISAGNSSFAKSALGQATLEAVHNATGFIIASMEKRPWEGRVADVEVEGKRITALYINAGSRIGLKVGDVLQVFRTGKPIIDSETGQIIGRHAGAEVGECRIESITPTLATAVPVDGQGFKKDDSVRLKGKS